MDNKEKYAHWLKAAENDINTADFMFDSGRYSYVAFMCEQALEKLAKGIYVYNFDKEAPFTHNINIILSAVENISVSEEYKKYEPIFSKLTSFYILGRYDIYKEEAAKSLDKENSQILLNQSKEAFLWLKSQVKL